MNKTYKYTLLTLFLSVVFVVGSMEGMNFILQVRERQFLSGNGRIVVEAPVRAWQEQAGGMEGENGENSQERYVLTVEQMEEVISSWDESTTVIHDPVNGQISMEEAMRAGKEWLAEMGMVENVDAGTHSMYATLSIMQKRSWEMQLEPYYSFWFVQYSSQSIIAYLYINAVTGRVWNADITLYEDLPEKVPYEKLSLFAELSGLPLSGSEVVFKNQEGTQAVLMAEGSPLCAEMEFYRSQTEYPYTGYGEESLPSYEEGILDSEHVILLFKLDVSIDDY